MPRPTRQIPTICAPRPDSPESALALRSRLWSGNGANVRIRSHRINTPSMSPASVSKQE